MMNNFLLFSPLLLQKLIWIPTRIILTTLGRLQIYGIEHLSSVNSNVIFMCNHASELDPILIPASLSFFSRFSPIYYVSKEKRFYRNYGWRKYIYGGTFFKLWGSHSVNSGMKNYDRALSTHLEILERGGNLCIFPEGGVSRNHTIRVAKGGVVFLANKSNVPVVPVYIYGTYDLSLVDMILCRRKFAVVFGKPIYVYSHSENVEIRTIKKEAIIVMGFISHIHSLLFD